MKTVLPIPPASMVTEGNLKTELLNAAGAGRRGCTSCRLRNLGTPQHPLRNPLASSRTLFELRLQVAALFVIGYEAHLLG